MRIQRAKAADERSKSFKQVTNYGHGFIQILEVSNKSSPLILLPTMSNAGRRGREAEIKAEATGGG